MTILTILLFLMIIGAIIAIETTELLSSVVCVGAVGFILSIAFLLLGAPDIAITQLVVEILVLIILIRATINRDLTSVSGDREFFGIAVTLAIVLVVAIVGINVFSNFPRLGDSVMDRMKDAAPSTAYLKEGVAKTGARNIVTAVHLDFRAFDTLGEVSVLFCAILGALAILRRTARREREQKDSESDAV